MKKEATTRQRPAGATSTGDGEPLPGAEKKEGDDATEAGGGNFHRGRGATAWGREEGGDDATKARGGNLLGGRGKVEDGVSLTAAEDHGAGVVNLSGGRGRVATAWSRR